MTELWIITWADKEDRLGAYGLWVKTKAWNEVQGLFIDDDSKSKAREYQWLGQKRRIIVVNEHNYNHDKIAQYLTERAEEVKKGTPGFPDELLVVAHASGTYANINAGLADKKKVFIVPLTHGSGATDGAIRNFLSSVEENGSEPNEEKWDELYADVTFIEKISRQLGFIKHELPKIWEHLPDILDSSPLDMKRIHKHAQVYRDVTLGDIRTMFHTGGVYKVEGKKRSIAPDKTLCATLQTAEEQVRRSAHSLDEDDREEMLYRADKLKWSKERIQELVPPKNADTSLVATDFQQLFGADGFLEKLQGISEPATMEDLIRNNGVLLSWRKKVMGEINEALSLIESHEKT